VKFLLPGFGHLHTGEALGASGRFAGFLAGLSHFVLYVSGLLGWLCKSGKVRDRKVNFAALRPLLYRMRELIYRSELVFLCLFGCCRSKLQEM